MGVGSLFQLAAFRSSGVSTVSMDLQRNQTGGSKPPLILSGCPCATAVGVL